MRSGIGQRLDGRAFEIEQLFLDRECQGTGGDGLPILRVLCRLFDK
jgi:hypothetical protein